ncbi:MULTISPECIES: sensor histidine kinase [Geobacillus]|jgi:signal transduction histidine kinase|uniref:histidine kinase n=3 Tax=Geobacillus TaxID=129337 RepID=A4IK58_GEOTN|nr:MULTISPECIES: HAMP domain-containing sensor histidine kinase [Geobacillus]ABO65712.1 Sensor protein ResE [Geobacillus thermodenitrificans NG80-2]ARA97837.1 two-component sensor histidine kinase [Geobacillus thermodenitrificans]ARP41404.1 Heme sensor protein HssS [Geobacillus thermodenitrificans]ATO37182.1 two-component sensor histidine kinase [Geobacillus thermodenitrificans]MED0664370.1 sensor histidine kinase [Geobacillus thermodenitrificans]
MSRDFMNPELRLSSGVLLSLMAFFFLVAFIMLKLHHEQLKSDYIAVFGSIASRIVEEHPELEQDIVPFMTTEISREEEEKGKEILAQYGLTEQLNDELFPYVHTAIQKNERAVVLLFLLMALSLFLLNYSQYRTLYSRIRQLALAAEKVVEGDFNIIMSETREGDFSKLAVAFNGMRNTIRNQLDELKKEKRFLADLLSDISHQLKTPLSSMIIYNEIMLGKQLSEEQQRMFLLQNEKQLERMKWLIQSLLKLAKLDAKALQMDRQQQSLNETVWQSIDDLREQAVEANVHIRFENSEEVEFNHDRLWLKEAFINIIKNSIEHTPPGGNIDITIVSHPLYTRVVIADTGEGISQDDLPHIFKRFYKAKTSKKPDSIGIGLALAKSIIEAHGGMIEAKSELGKGTTFSITFLNY